MERLPPRGGGNKPDRKTVERDRRNHMNELYSHLDDLVRAGGGAPPPTGGRPAATRPDRLGEAAEYIRRTEESVDRLKEKMRVLTEAAHHHGSAGSSSGAAPASPEVEVRAQHLGSGLHAILVTGARPNDGAAFHRAVRTVAEAGGEVQNAHLSVVAGARALYTIHTLVGEGHGGGIERVVQRLKEAMIHGSGGSN
ncbi:hypothetical protein ABZP36_031540 [Zizania latifolia]